MIEKNEDVWKCKICGKTANHNSNIRAHVEQHIEGMSYACHICSKTFTIRPGLNKHVSNLL